jgi:hypothetical protein
VPISRQEFEDGRIDLAVPVVDYLRVRREDAFTAQEILDEMIIFGRRCTLAEIIQSLERLVTQEIVLRKVLAGIPRYIISSAERLVLSQGLVMPLSKRQFELGVDEEGENLMIQVYDLLAANPDLAYSHSLYNGSYPNLCL